MKDLYDQLMEMVIEEDTIEEYKNRRSLQEFKFIERLADKFKNKKINKNTNKNINNTKENIEDAKYILKQVEPNSDFKKLYLGEALCKEGININESKTFPQEVANMLVNQYNAKQPIHMYWFKGRTMNGFFDLKGSNAYNDNYSFFVIDLADIPKLDDVLAAKRNLGFRYFSDIVDNNEYQEFAAGRHPYTKQIKWLYDVYERDGIKQRPRDNEVTGWPGYGLGLSLYS